jgi:hypothetical protein
MNKEILKRRRDQEIAATMRDKPQICPKSARLSKSAIRKVESQIEFSPPQTD